MRCLAQGSLFTQEEFLKITKCSDLVGLDIRLTVDQIANTKSKL